MLAQLLSTPAWKEAGYIAAAGLLYGTAPITAVGRLISGTPGPEATGRPVLLPHGALHNYTWSLALQRHLTREGHPCVESNYPTLDLQEAADHVTSHIVDAADQYGPVHIVAHSLGGLVVRDALTRPGMTGTVNTVVTLGTPHQGSPLAIDALHAIPVLASTAQDLTPGSAYLVDLDARSHSAGATWHAVTAGRDIVVPASHARLTHPAYRARHHHLPDLGHAGLMYDSDVARLVARLLAN